MDSSTHPLLVPRYRVKAKYFFSPYNVGDIITMPTGGRSVILTQTQYRDEFGDDVLVSNMYSQDTLREYPALFEPIPWYEGLQVKDMPEYVRLNPENTIGGDEVFKVLDVKEYADGIGLAIREPGPTEYSRNHIAAKYFIPATEAEYNAYLQSQTK